MKNKELFDRTISILVKAYQNDTLEHHNCYACAVGNLMAENCGFRLIKTPFKFSEIYYTGYNGTLIYEPLLPIEQVLTYNLDRLESSDFINDIIKKVGYTLNELSSIEAAFEGGTYKRDDHDKDGFYGLMNVVDALMEIHEAEQKEIDEAKSLFVKA